jgi:hypothetical protein
MMERSFGVVAEREACGRCRGDGRRSVDVRGCRVCPACLREMNADPATKRNIMLSFAE